MAHHGRTLNPPARRLIATARPASHRRRRNAAFGKAAHFRLISSLPSGFSPAATSAPPRDRSNPAFGNSEPPSASGAVVPLVSGAQLRRQSAYIRR